MGEKLPPEAREDYSKNDSDPWIVFMSASADGEYVLTIWTDLGQEDVVNHSFGPDGYFGMLRIYSSNESDMPVHEETVGLSDSTAHFARPSIDEIQLWDSIMRRHTGSLMATFADEEKV
jgi:hypothetical protein